MLIKAASSLRLEIGMPSLILWFQLPTLQKTVWLSSLLQWELETNAPMSQVLMSDCHFDISSVNYSDSKAVLLFLFLTVTCSCCPLLQWEQGTNAPRSQVLMSDCHFDISSVNYSDSKAVLLFLFLTVTCSCCPYLYFGSPIMWVI